MFQSSLLGRVPEMLRTSWLQQRKMDLWCRSGEGLSHPESLCWFYLFLNPFHSDDLSISLLNKLQEGKKKVKFQQFGRWMRSHRKCFLYWNLNGKKKKSPTTGVFCSCPWTVAVENGLFSRYWFIREAQVEGTFSTSFPFLISWLSFPSIPGSKMWCTGV